MVIINTIKAQIPKKLKNRMRRYLAKYQGKACYKYDIDRFVNYSNAFFQNDNSEKLIGTIIREYHAIEKGLTMPKMSLGFGNELLKKLIDHCYLYANNYNVINEQFNHALEVISEYKLVHERKNFKLNDELLQLINDILIKFPIDLQIGQISITKKEYLKYANSSFEKFSNSRHSLRNFNGKVEIELIVKVIKLAQNAPSACNRQPSRCYIIQDKGLIRQTLILQSGSRGFGNLADKLIILTVELGVFNSLKERNEAFLNGGIFAMNLLYSLHYYQIGACALNWSSLPDEDLKLRSVCNINSSESVILIIACGGIPDKFELAKSYRSDVSNIIKIR